GNLLAHFLSRRSGLGNVPKPPPFDATSDLGAPDPGMERLKSKAFKGDAVMEAVALGHAVLARAATKQAGGGLVQDALNRLAANGHPEFAVDFMGNPNLRGSFGPRTASAVSAFQTARGLTATGEVDDKTIEALDADLVQLDQQASSEGTQPGDTQ